MTWWTHVFFSAEMCAVPFYCRKGQVDWNKTWTNQTFHSRVSLNYCRSSINYSWLTSSLSCPSPFAHLGFKSTMKIPLCPSRFWSTMGKKACFQCDRECRIDGIDVIIICLDGMCKERKEGVSYCFFLDWIIKAQTLLNRSPNLFSRGCNNWQNIQVVITLSKHLGCVLSCRCSHGKLNHKDGNCS